MTAKSALIKALLDGQVLNIKNCFRLIGLTNCPREISRMIEKPFEVKVTRTDRSGHSRFGQAVVWVDYKLENTELNKPGIQKMIAFYEADGDKKQLPHRPKKQKAPPAPIEQKVVQTSLF